MFKKILVANRGEIAVRVMRTAHRLGIRTVAVHSDVDAEAVHVTIADESVCIGGSAPDESYLIQEKIVAAALSTGAEAVHPGYGFLSERAEFSRACTLAGLTFVGPSPEAMERLGAKVDAKRLAVDNGVPVCPGYFEPSATLEDLRNAADQIGYPVMLKASAGGGGRGMRVVRDPAHFDQEHELAKDEAIKGFGDGTMMVEKYIERPRHIEIQLLADKHGQIATLFERECSLQRRHQKVIEEAPSPVMTSSLWEKMRGAARTLATAAGYHGAGTVEFMVDAEAGEFYFLEVNARLQVEHPVTEAITGLDLVEHQLRIAAGERLSIDQRLIEGDRSAICGHAIEARVTAEDPAMGYLPSTGKILGWAMSSDPSVRSDSGYERGSEVSRFYDSLLAKVICHSQDRASATSMLRQALCDTHILGVKTNIEFMIDVLNHPEFASADFDTSWLGRSFENWTRGGGLPRGLLEVVTTATNSVSTGGMSGKTTGAFDLPDGFRLTQKRA